MLEEIKKHLQNHHYLTNGDLLYKNYPQHLFIGIADRIFMLSYFLADSNKYIFLEQKMYLLR